VTTSRTMATIGLVVCVWGLSARPAAAQPGNLNFFKNYFVTGDYRVHGIGLKGTGTNGFATAAINVSGIPEGADVLAAFLYWQTIVQQGNSGAAGATFRGFDISTAKELNPFGSAPCWSSGGGTGGADGAKKMKAYRADVRRYLPLGTNGKREANGSHQVMLPDSGSGNAVPMTLGASLVVLFRDPTPGTPLRSVVIYDGGYTMDQSTDSFTQTLQGFYQASLDGPAARMTHIVANGQAGFSERLLFDNQMLSNSINPFVGAQGPEWDNVEFTGLPLQPGASSAVVTVDHVNINPFDCLSWGAVIMSTAVQDTDLDGLLDIWESSTTTLFDPLGDALPNLAAMGASPTVKDVFIEIGHMWTNGYTAGQGVVGAHTHLPAKNALNMVAQAFRNAPVDPLPGNKFKGINIHFDVGSHHQPQSPPSLASCTNPATWTVECAIIPTSLARGGEAIEELACTATPCQFPDYPGTVGWKSGYRILRDQPLNYTTEPACVAAGLGCVRRFDRNRRDIFRYALFAHALGLPKSNDPASPDFHVPKQTSGIADFVGADLMVTLGFWDDFVGTDEIQASTLMHELGHTFGRRHGGDQGQPNCKPNYQSVMNYLFQVGLLINANGQPEIGYSKEVLPGLQESSLSEAAGLGTMLYRTRWYAPFSSSYIDQALNTTPATKFCTGVPVPLGLEVVRVDGTGVQPPIDWNADGQLSPPLSQDINFDNSVSALDPGTNDWLNLDLRQVGARRNVGLVSLDFGYTDVGSPNTLGYTDVGYTDLGYTDVGYTDVGYTDVGYTDVGITDLGYTDVGAPQSGDLDFTTAREQGGNAPFLNPAQMSAAKGKAAVILTWRGPNVANENATYTAFRVDGTGLTPANFASRIIVGTTTDPVATVTDTTVKNNNTYTYFVQAQLGNGDRTGISNLRTITVK
jgi:hypothetical protein